MIKPKETGKALTFMDDRGWLYQVRQLLGGDLFRIFCRKPRKNPDPDIGWKSRPRSRIHLSRETAEDALRALAKRKGWTKMDFDTEDVMAMSEQLRLMMDVSMDEVNEKAAEKLRRALSRWDESRRESYEDQ